MRAAQEGVTVTSLIEDALRDHLRGRSTPQTPRPLPRLPQSGGTHPGVRLDDNRAIRDLLDEDTPTHSAGT